MTVKENGPAPEEPALINILLVNARGTFRKELIRAVFAGQGDDHAMPDGQGSDLLIYTDRTLGYRILDAHELSGPFLQQQAALWHLQRAVRKLDEGGGSGALISVVWYCVETASADRHDLDRITGIERLFPGTPVIAIVTGCDGTEAGRMIGEERIREQFAHCDPHHRVSLADVVAVRAGQVGMEESDGSAVFGIERLAARTNEILPTADRIGTSEMNRKIADMRHRWGDTAVAAYTAAAVTVGAVPLPVPDAPLLSGIQAKMVKKIAGLYHLDSASVTGAILDAAVVTLGAKNILALLKAVPGLNVAASILDAAVAGLVTAAVGETANFICYQIQVGALDKNDLEKIRHAVTEKADTVFGKLLPQIRQVMTKEGGLTLDDLVSFFHSLLK